MLTQWQCLLKNLGEWEGSFTLFSPLGELTNDVPSVLTLDGFNDNTQLRLVLRRFPENQPPQENILEFKDSNPLGNLLLAETGAFSSGSTQVSSGSQWGAELALVDGDRRLRLVPIYNVSAQFDRVTLIREKQASTNPPELPQLTLEQLLGEWQGEAVTIYPDGSCLEPLPTHLKVELTEHNTILQQLTYGIGGEVRTITSSATLEGSRLLFNQSTPPVQILFLPGGASCNCPVEVPIGKNFVLELGWLITPTRRQRLIRSYNNQGQWVSMTLVEEHKTMNNEQ